jgi:DNA-binding SARP family transcriptional activator
MRTCNTCGKKKALEDYNWKEKAKGRRSTTCRECMKLYIQKHYKNNTQYYVEKARRRNKLYREETHRKIFEYLSTHPCVDCNESDPFVLEFDHIVKETKIAAVSSMISGLKSWSLIEKEIKKCEVRCANCHRRRTAKQQGWHLYLTASQGNSP